MGSTYGTDSPRMGPLRWDPSVAHVWDPSAVVAHVWDPSAVVALAIALLDTDPWPHLCLTLTLPLPLPFRVGIPLLWLMATCTRMHASAQMSAPPVTPPDHRVPLSHQAGAFGLVIECVPEVLGGSVSSTATLIPTLLPNPPSNPVPHMPPFTPYSLALYPYAIALLRPPVVPPPCHWICCARRKWPTSSPGIVMNAL